MKKSTKIVTLILMLVLTFSVFAVSAFAAESAEEIAKDIVEELEKEASTKIEVDFDAGRFVDSLQYMWKGMLCIFIVIGAIILCIYGLNKGINAIVAKKAQKTEDQ
ncbi:MAG: hypothetical protein E7673_00610 [Ruminococcaceae bacterium]|nr:hypothetical protein [Oscillospiraceae bacterium]